MKTNKLNYKLVNVALLLVCCFLIYLTAPMWFGIAKKFISAITPFVIAFAIAYALYPVLRFMEEKGIPKGIGISIIVILLLSFIFLLFYALIPMVIDQMILLVSNSIKYIPELSKNLNIDLSVITDSLKDINTLINNFGKFFSDLSMNIFNKTLAIFSIGIVSLMVSIYFLIDMEKMRRGLKKHLKKINIRTFKYVQLLDEEMSRYFIGLGKYIIVRFIQYTLIFWLIGHPYFLILGLLSALAALIPYFGGIAVSIISIIFSLAIGTKLLIVTIIISLVLPNIDSYIISPRIYGKSNNIPRLLSIFSVFTFGVLFGVMGIIISLPMTIIILNTIKFYENDIAEKLENIKEKM